MRHITFPFLMLLVPLISSCVVSFPEHTKNTTYVMVSESDLCRLYRLDGYALDELPDLDSLGSNKIDELKALSMLAEHVMKLRTDIRNLKSTECN